MTLQAFIGEYLTFLERREERLLSWGFHNVRWTIAEIEEVFPDEAPEELRLAWEKVSRQGHTFTSLTLQMRQCNLVYGVPDDPGSYRTRFAEGVRLLANLRQMFKEADWATGPRLVSDIKLQITPRLYPRRDQAAKSVWEALSPHCPPVRVDLIRECFFALAAKKDVGGYFDFAGFQQRAFVHIFSRYGSKGSGGSVVCAGTGSGKTKAFYVPAFLRIVQDLDRPAFTKVIAFYPRNVLLADQLREAISEAEKLRPVLARKGLRSIRFGALLGDTPHEDWFEKKEHERKGYHWDRRGNASVIPYLKSPSDGGRSDLMWRDADRRAGRTALYKDQATEPDVRDGVLAITREDLQANPPDVLFVSLEMLNREMCTPGWERTFGMRRGREQAPRLLLLDEVHAHEGLPGAQVAWVLRRWRHWARIQSLHVVGLSATLRDAPQHLARVAGLRPGEVEEFRPVPGLEAAGGEMEAEGGEYQLAVKGDPAAGAALLGTSIQAGMLLARLLTPRTQGLVGGNAPISPDVFYRKKVFGFSDNLDSVNRWFNDMVDADNTKRLASLRKAPAPGVPEPIRRRRFNEGQVWELPRLIGHNLDSPLVVTRCTSQDPGADTSSDLIIATSSLEVGFDDPEVGAMLHHKRPGSMSSFIQRKGRAGRTRGARPWTVVILSDYGADRWAFHSAERLFQPEVDSLVLPALNPYVLRVQLAHFLIDWIGRETGLNSSAFRCLQGPSSWHKAYQERASELLRALLDQGTMWKRFEGELKRFFETASGLGRDASSDLLDNLLWHEPRPLLMEVIPSLLRKLEVEWSYVYPPQKGAVEDAGAKRPLPQFIPKATFADLDAGEAVVTLEPFGRFERDPESMAISRLFFEACPGRVSKRFATGRNEPGYWHPMSVRLQAGANTASIAELFPQANFLEDADGVSVFQPEAVALLHRPQGVSDTSNGQWIWQTMVRTEGEGEPLPVHHAIPWREVFGAADAFLHSNAAWIDVLRYSEESRFDMRRDKQAVSGSLRLQRDAGDGKMERQAIGFRLRADGVRFMMSAAHLDSRPLLSSAMMERFRADYFRHSLLQSPGLVALVNSFQIGWLADISLAMLTATALSKKCRLPEAQRHLDGRRSQAARRVLDVIFQMRGVNVSGAEEEAKLQAVLTDAWNQPAVRDEIIACESVIWQEPDDDFRTWVRQRYAATLAQAIRAAMVALAPQVSEDELVLDVLPGGGGGFDLTVTESSPGGVGQIETIVREMQRQPRRFLDGLEFALHHCEREQSAGNLLAVAGAACDPASPLPAAFEGARAASGFSALEEAKGALRASLQEQGFPTSRKSVVSIVNKLLRPGSGTWSDQLIHRFNRAWHRRTRRLGIAVPPRTFCYLCAQHPKFGPSLSRLLENIGGERPSDPQLFAQLQQLVIESCPDSCPECLHQPGRYYDLGLPSRELARAWLGIGIQEIVLHNHHADWVADARSILCSSGRVRLVASPARREELARALPDLAVAEIGLESILASVAVARIEQSADRIAVVLHIPDFTHG